MYIHYMTVIYCICFTMFDLLYKPVFKTRETLQQPTVHARCTLCTVCLLHQSKTSLVEVAYSVVELPLYYFIQKNENLKLASDITSQFCFAFNSHTCKQTRFIEKRNINLRSCVCAPCFGLVSERKKIKLAKRFQK